MNRGDRCGRAIPLGGSFWFSSVGSFAHGPTGGCHKSGGLPEIVVDRVTGLTVERENDKQLAEAIAFLIDQS